MSKISTLTVFSASSFTNQTIWWNMMMEMLLCSPIQPVTIHIYCRENYNYVSHLTIHPSIHAYNTFRTHRKVSRNCNNVIFWRTLYVKFVVSYSTYRHKSLNDWKIEKNYIHPTWLWCDFDEQQKLLQWFIIQTSVWCVELKYLFVDAICNLFELVDGCCDLLDEIFTNCKTFMLSKISFCKF